MPALRAARGAAPVRPGRARLRARAYRRYARAPGPDHHVDIVIISYATIDHHLFIPQRQRYAEAWPCCAGLDAIVDRERALML